MGLSQLPRTVHAYPAGRPHRDASPHAALQQDVLTRKPCSLHNLHNLQVPYEQVGAMALAHTQHTLHNA